MAIRFGNKSDPADSLSHDDLPAADAFVSQPHAADYSADRNWLYRAPGIPSDGKGKPEREQNPWISSPPRPATTASPPEPSIAAMPVVAQFDAVPPAPPSPFMTQAPTVFLNPAPSVGPSVYGHEPVAPREDPVLAVTKAIVSTVGVCLGLWFAISLDVASLMLFFPFSFNAWEGNTVLIPMLGISAFIAFLMALWIGDQWSWWWGVFAFFFLPVVFAVYVYKQNRGLLTRSGRPAAKFPTMLTIGSMVAFAVFLLVTSFIFMLHNYGDEIQRGDPPFDQFSSMTPSLEDRK
jgi:hypothetical protein